MTKPIKIYLAIPYTGMEESAFHQATKATAQLIQEGYNVFSPITHSHPLVEYGVAGNWGFWEKIDEQFIEWCDVVAILVPEEGFDKVENSTGVNAEINIASRLNKPVTYFHEVSEAMLDEIEYVLN
jgi:nucleoside 2-deoxyribosyltransferase